MRILYLAKTQIPSRTANSVHIMKICQAFARNGHEVRLLVPELDGREMNIADVFEFYGVEKVFSLEFLSWPKSRGQSLLYGYRCARRAQALKPDLVYGRYLPGCFFSALLGLTTIFEAHTSMESFSAVERWMFKRLIRSPNLERVVVISQALGNWFRNKYPALKDKIQVAHDGADLPAAVVPENLGSKGRFRAGYVGSLFPGKGMELIAKLVPLCEEVDFYILGGSDPEIEDWKKRLCGFKNIFFIGFVPPSQAEAYRKAMDVLLAPFQEKVLILGKSDVSRWMSPLKIFEYMASQKAIVASDLPVLREVLNERNSVLVKSDDAHAWRQAIEKLLSDEPRRSSLSRRAYEDFCSQYTWEQRARHVIEGLK